MIAGLTNNGIPLATIISDLLGIDFGMIRPSREGTETNYASNYAGLENKNIVLVDDVISSGSTAKEAINFIKKSNGNSELTSHQLDHVLEEYYLKTETPTMEYVYSLCALASQTPLDLQPILECINLEQLLERTTKLLESDINHE